MKLISWNVNGLRACLNKGFDDFFTQAQADVFCLQETKLQAGQVQLEYPGYTQYWNYAQRKGYSGTAIFSRVAPLSVCYDIGVEEHATEGRTITLEFEDFYLLNVYTPNAQKELARIEYRMRWEDDFRAYALGLAAQKPLVICGDLNVAHKPIDLKKPKANENNAGYSPQEREKFTALLDSGFIDTFRHLYPDQEDAYTWWSYMFKARERNVGWRIDYFLVSQGLQTRVRDSVIHAQVMGSDHCPVELQLG